MDVSPWTRARHQNLAEATSEVRFCHPVYRLLPMARKGGRLWRDQLQWKRFRRPMIALDLVYYIRLGRYEESRMISRRMFILSGAVGAIAATKTFAQTPSPNDPTAILTAIYSRAARGKGDGGGAFVIESKAAKAKYLSKSLVELWAKADAHTPKGDVGPVDFDPVTNSQEPDVKSFELRVEKPEAQKATLAVTITGHRTRGKPSDQVVHYDFVHEAGQWKIDNIKGSSDGEPWSIRAMLASSLKN